MSSSSLSAVDDGIVRFAFFSSLNSAPAWPVIRIGSKLSSPISSQLTRAKDQLRPDCASSSASSSLVLTRKQVPVPVTRETAVASSTTKGNGDT